MDSAIVTAMAATLGSLAGAGASLATTWLTQRTQRIRANTEWRLRERQALYEGFITEASRMSIDALVHSLEKPEQLIALYGILGRIRLMSCDRRGRGWQRWQRRATGRTRLGLRRVGSNTAGDAKQVAAQIS